MKKLVLGKVPKDELPVWNSIFRHNGDVVFDVGGERLRLLFIPGAFPVESELAVRMSCEQHSFWIDLKISDSVLERHISETFGDERVSDLPEEIRTAVCEVIFEDLLTRFESWKGLKTRIEAVQLHPAGRRYARSLPFQVAGSKAHPLATGCFGLDEGSLRWFSQLFAEVRSSIPQPCHAIPVNCRLEVGKTQLALGELRAVDRLDLIKVDEYYPLQDKKVVLHFHPSVSYWALIEDNRLMVQNKKEEQVSPNETAIQDLDAVEIDLKFEVGEKQIPLSDLSNLKAGYTFELDVPLDRLVTIRANGKIVGCGELVQIDEHIGVRVLEVFRNAADQHA
jgi:type III secretion protein Q